MANLRGKVGDEGDMVGADWERRGVFPLGKSSEGDSEGIQKCE